MAVVLNRLRNRLYWKTAKGEPFPLSTTIEDRSRLLGVSI
nr:MAG TPA: hypothetical protein [Caudoviricetes sp.]